jgi:hypothetical protein
MHKTKHYGLSVFLNYLRIFSPSFRVNTESQCSITLANKAIRKVCDFTYLGSNVSQDGGTYKDVETRIQKARGTFTRVRKIWQAHYINKGTKIKLFNVL